MPAEGTLRLEWLDREVDLRGFESTDELADTTRATAISVHELEPNPGVGLGGYFALELSLIHIFSSAADIDDEGCPEPARVVL